MAKIVPDRAVDAINFIAHSPDAKEALKSASLLKSLKINALIEGDPGTGRGTLAKYILPHAPVFSAAEAENFDSLGVVPNGLVVLGIQSLRRTEAFFAWVKKNGIRVVATYDYQADDRFADTYFSTRIYLKPLKERQEDVRPLAEQFFIEAKEVLGDGGEMETVLEHFQPDLSENCHTLRRSVFFAYLVDSIGEKEIMKLLERHFQREVKGNNAYRDLLYLFEAPLLRASLEKYKSQLQVSRILGLNRNTLRKKISEMGEFL